MSQATLRELEADKKSSASFSLYMSLYQAGGERKGAIGS